MEQVAAASLPQPPFTIKLVPWCIQLTCCALLAACTLLFILWRGCARPFIVDTQGLLLRRSRRPSQCPDRPQGYRRAGRSTSGQRPGVCHGRWGRSGGSLLHVAAALTLRANAGCRRAGPCLWPFPETPPSAMAPTCPCTQAGGLLTPQVASPVAVTTQSPSRPQSTYEGLTTCRTSFVCTFLPACCWRPSSLACTNLLRHRRRRPFP